MLEVLPELKSYLVRKRWQWKPVDGQNVAVKTCPFCGRSKYKFYIHATKTIYRCWHCDARGNLYKLKRELGDLQGVVSATQLAGGEKAKGSKPVDMELIEKWHRQLFKSQKVLSYLREQRGFADETIAHFKLGLQKQNGELWLAIPHIVAGVCHNVKFRSLPPAEKAFRRVKGAASVLFHADALADSSDIVIAEAETDAMSLWQAGIKHVVGLTCGADTFLPEWYDDLADKERVTVCLDADAVGQQGARAVARRLGFDKCYNVLLPYHDANEMLTQAGGEELARTVEHAEQFEVAGIVSITDALLRCKEEAEIGDAGLLTPWGELNAILGKGWHPGDLVVLSAKIKVGKALRHGEKVWTRDGEVPIEELTTNDQVLGLDGTAYPVTGVFPQGMRPIYRVRFSDEATLDVDGEHLWTVTRYSAGGKRKEVTLTTLEILRSGLRRRSGWKYQIPMPAPLHLAKAPLDFDPYLMGVCLGDGCLTQSSLTIANIDPETRAHVAMGIPKTLVTHAKDSVCFSIVNPDRTRWARNPLRTALRAYGVLGLRAEEKHIPRPFLLSCAGNRVALLQGLMDTDGTVGKNGQLSFTTVSYQLALDLKYLVETLGGRGSICPRKSKGQPAFAVHFSVHHSITPFLQHWKRSRFEQLRKRRTRQRNFRSIVAITPVGKAPATCISVASPDQLFVCQHGIVTHNTTWALNVADHHSAQGTPALIYCLEMSTDRLGQKHAALVRRKPVDLLTAVDYELVRYKVRSQPLYFVEPDWGGSFKVEAVLDKIREAVKRYGIKLLVFDHLHFLCRSLQYLTTEIGQVTRAFKLLAQELNIVILLIAQPKKIEGSRVIRYDDIKDSSSIPADADQILLLHRAARPVGLDDDSGKVQASEQEVLEPKTLVRVDAARFRGGGECFLYYDGAASTFLDWEDRPAREL
jgi:replicative DNA helicase